jgi:hypothetical protein
VSFTQIHKIFPLKQACSQIIAEAKAGFGEQLELKQIVLAPDHCQTKRK